jgi:hypothetical protein
MLGLSPGFGQAVRTFLIDAMVSAKSGITTTGHVLRPGEGFLGTEHEAELTPKVPTNIL